MQNQENKDNKFFVKFGIFGITPIRIYQDKRLKPNDRDVYTALSSFQGANDSCTPKLSEIAERAGKTIDAVSKSLNNLAKTGWIRKMRRGKGLSNKYECLCPIDESEFEIIEDGRKNNQFKVITENFQNQEIIQNQENFQNSENFQGVITENFQNLESGKIPKSINKKHMKKTYKKTKKDASVFSPEIDKELYNKISESFHYGYKKQTGSEAFPNYKKEGSNIKTVIKRTKTLNKDSPEEFIHKIIRYYWLLVNSGKKYFKDKPFLPSSLSGDWEQVVTKVMKEKLEEEIEDPEFDDFVSNLNFKVG